MNTVTVSAGQFAAACLAGFGLGAVYALLRPLPNRLRGLTDGVFILAVGYAWLQVSFRICGGDIRMIHFAGLLFGIWAFRMTLGKPLQRAIGRFSEEARAIFPASAGCPGASSAAFSRFVTGIRSFPI